MKKMLIEPKLQFENTKLNGYSAHRLLCNISENREMALYYALYGDVDQVEKSKKGIIFLRCEYTGNRTKDRTPLDIIECIVSSFKIVGTSEIEQKNILDYKNFIWGYSFKYDKAKYRIENSKLVSKEYPQGALTTIVKPIVLATEDMSLDLWVNEIMQMYTDNFKDTVWKKSRIYIDGNMTCSITISSAAMKDQQKQLYICRVMNKWYMIQWETSKSDFEKK